ncbi:MAG: peptidoglycan DD-metalloendopeptidase family protein, partial [Gammaproteobacteria bacterium]
MDVRAICAIALALLLAACGTTGGNDQARKQLRTYTVRHGETLYSISWRYGLDYKHVAAWNGIEPPYTIHPGQKIRLNPSSRTARTKPGKRKNKPTAVVTTPLPASPPPKAATGGEPLHWRWPTQGKVIGKFSPGSAGSKGIDIAGQHGQLITAASAGKVVYSGSGLVGYGQLIIIKHNDRYLSAYAHNRKLLVKEGV